MPANIAGRGSDPGLPHELRGQYRHLVAQPFTLSLIEAGPEEIIGEDNCFRHQPDHPSQMPVSSLAYPACPFVLA
jgi:hypothetical protein